MREQTNTQRKCPRSETSREMIEQVIERLDAGYDEGGVSCCYSKFGLVDTDEWEGIVDTYCMALDNSFDSPPSARQDDLTFVKNTFDGVVIAR